MKPMWVEDWDEPARAFVFQTYWNLTCKALLEVFGQTPEQADALIQEFRLDLAGWSVPQQNLQLHWDPLSLACELTETEWNTIPQDLMQAYFDSRGADIERGIGIYGRGGPGDPAPAHVRAAMFV